MRSLLRDRREWRLAPSPDASLVEIIRASVGCSHAIAVLLAQRGGSAWDALLDPVGERFHPASDLPDMDRAVSRLIEAIQ
jgi:hypothetical protein